MGARASGDRRGDRGGVLVKGPTNWDVLLVFLLSMAVIVFLAWLVFGRLDGVDRAVCTIDPIAGEHLRGCEDMLP